MYAARDPVVVLLLSGRVAIPMESARRFCAVEMLLQRLNMGEAIAGKAPSEGISPPEQCPKPRRGSIRLSNIESIQNQVSKPTTRQM